MNGNVELASVQAIVFSYCQSLYSVLALRRVGPNAEVFCKGYDYEENADLSKTYWNPKRKLWVIVHF